MHTFLVGTERDKFQKRRPLIYSLPLGPIRNMCMWSSNMHAHMRIHRPKNNNDNNNDVSNSQSTENNATNNETYNETNNPNNNHLPEETYLDICKYICALKVLFPNGDFGFLDDNIGYKLLEMRAPSFLFSNPPNNISRYINNFKN